MIKDYYFNVIGTASEADPEHVKVEIEAFAGKTKALYTHYSDRADYVTVTTLSAKIEGNGLLTADEAIAAASELNPSLFSLTGHREYFKGAREFYKGTHKVATSYASALKWAATNTLLKHIREKKNGRED